MDISDETEQTTLSKSDQFYIQNLSNNENILKELSLENFPLNRSLDFFELKYLHKYIENLKGNIRIVSKVRSISDEVNTNNKNIINIDNESTIVISTKKGQKTFELDYIFPETSTHLDIFSSLKSSIQNAIFGNNLSLIFFGQTGSGKTYTLRGTSSTQGLFYHSLHELFQLLTLLEPKFLYKITMNMLQFSINQCFDLFKQNSSIDQPSKIHIEKLSTGQISIENAYNQPIESLEQAISLLNQGYEQLAINCQKFVTNLCRASVLFRISVSIYNKNTCENTIGILNFLELSSSERASKLNSTTAQMRDISSVGKILSTLVDVIYAVKNKMKFIPFRNNYVSYVLSDCFNSDDTVIVFFNISPLEKDCEETIATLSTAARIIPGENRKEISKQDIKNIEDKVREAFEMMARGTSLRDDYFAE